MRRVTVANDHAGFFVTATTLDASVNSSSLYLGVLTCIVRSQSGTCCYLVFQRAFVCPGLVCSALFVLYFQWLGAKANTLRFPLLRRFHDYFFLLAANDPGPFTAGPFTAFVTFFNKRQRHKSCLRIFRSRKGRCTHTNPLP